MREGRTAIFGWLAAVALAMSAVMPVVAQGTAVPSLWRDFATATTILPVSAKTVNDQVLEVLLEYEKEMRVTGSFCATVKFWDYPTLLELIDLAKENAMEFSHWEKYLKCANSFYEYDTGVSTVFSVVSEPYIDRINKIYEGNPDPIVTDNPWIMPVIPYGNNSNIYSMTRTLVEPPPIEVMKFISIGETGKPGLTEPPTLRQTSLSNTPSIIRTPKPASTVIPSNSVVVGMTPVPRDYRPVILLALIAGVIIGVLFYRQYARNQRRRATVQRKPSVQPDGDKAANDSPAPKTDTGDGNTNLPGTIMPLSGAAHPTVDGEMTGMTLIGVAGNYVGQRIALRQAMTTIGRNPDCTVVIREYLPGVSREHCMIRFRSGTNDYQIVDNGSTYGTYVNDVRLDKGTPVVLKAGDVIALGSKNAAFRVEL